MKHSEKSEARQLIVATAIATMTALERMAETAGVKQAVKSDRLRKAIDYVARSRDKQLAQKADAGQAKKAENAPKPGKLSRLARTIGAVCSMNPSQEERDAARRSAWAGQAKKSDYCDDPIRVFDSMFKG